MEATAAAVVAGVFLQAFSVAAYVRGAGQGGRGLHVTGGFITHNIEIVVFLLAELGRRSLHDELHRRRMG